MLKFFEQLALESSSAELSVLLGNGFVASLHPGFCYESIVDLLLNPDPSSSDQVSKKVAQILSVTNTVDVEDSIRALTVARKVLPLYDEEGKAVSQKMGIDIEELRRALATAITSRHPREKCAIAPSMYKCCAANISTFHYVFTTNYDLMVEWSCIPSRDYESRFRLNDGFRYFHRAKHGWFRKYKDDKLPFTREGMPSEYSYRPRVPRAVQTLFYLHGAMHFHMKNAELVKFLPVRDDGDMFFVEVCEEFIRAKQFPHVVIEGSSEAKMAAINRSPYLRACYDALLSRHGILYVFGSRLYDKDHDTHLVQAIINSMVHKVVFGYRAGRRSPASRAIIESHVRVWSDERHRLCLADPQRPELEVQFCDTDDDAASFWTYSSLSKPLADT